MSIRYQSFRLMISNDDHENDRDEDEDDDGVYLVFVAVVEENSAKILMDNVHWY